MAWIPSGGRASRDVPNYSPPVSRASSRHKNSATIFLAPGHFVTYGECQVRSSVLSLFPERHAGATPRIRMATPRQIVAPPLDVKPASYDDREWAAHLMAHSEPWITLGRTLEGCRSVCHHPDHLVFTAITGLLMIGVRWPQPVT